MAGRDASSGGDVIDFLAHHGIKGMHWGVRRKKSSSSSNAHEDAARAKSAHDKLKSEGIHSLSNKELQDMLTRMDLEQRYSRISGSNRSKTQAGAKFVSDLLVNIGKQQMTKLASDLATKKLKEVMQ